MEVLRFGLISFAASLALQLAIWRIRRPARQARGLLVIFAVVPLLLSPAILPGDASEALHALLLAAALAGAWLITYSAVEVDSPSIHMVRAVSQAGAAGMSEEELRAAFPDEVLLSPRVADLVTDRMVRLENGQYRLTGKGRRLADLFAAYRRLLGLGMGG